MFDRFSDDSRKVMTIAREEAQRLGHDYIGTEHVLVALAAQGGSASRALSTAGLDAARLRAALERVVPRGASNLTGQLPFTPGSKHALESALEAAREMNHTVIAGEHLLLGVLAHGKGTAAEVLEAAGVKPEAVRDEVVRGLGADPGPVGASASPSRHDLEPSPAAAALLRRAVDETRKAAHRFAGTEHLLLAASLDTGSLGKALDALGLAPDAVRHAIARLRLPVENEEAPSRPPFTPRAVKALDRAGEECRSAKRRSVTGRDIALGVLSVEDGLAFTIVRSLGADAASVRAGLRSLPAT